MKLKDLLKKATKTTSKVAKTTTAGKIAEAISKVPAVKTTAAQVARVPKINKLVEANLAEKGINYANQLKDQENRTVAASMASKTGVLPFTSPGAAIVKPAINFNLSDQQIGQNISNVLSGNYDAQQAFLQKRAVSPIAQAAQAPIGVAKSLGNLAVGTFELFPGAKSLTRTEGNQRKEGLRFLEPKGQGQEVGKVITDIASFFAPQTAFTKLGQAGQLGSLLGKIQDLKGVSGFLARLAGQTAGAGAVSAAQQGELNDQVAKDVAITAATGVVAPALSSFLKGAARKAAEIAIPTTKGIRDKLAAKGVNLANAVNEAGFSFTKGSLGEKLQLLASKKSKFIDNLVDNVSNGNKKTYTINDFVDNLADKVKKDKKLKTKLELTPATDDAITAKIDEVEEIYKAKYKDKVLSLNDLQALKKDLYQGLKNAFAIDSKRELAVTAGEKAVAKSLRRQIEQEIPEVKKLNEELGAILEGSRILNEKGGGYKELFYDAITGVIGATSASTSNQDISSGDVLKGALLLMLARRGLNSTAGTTAQVKVATTVSKMADKIAQNPVVAPAINNFIEAIKTGTNPEVAQDQFLQDILGADYQERFGQTETNTDPSTEADLLLQELGIEQPSEPTSTEFTTKDGITIVF